MVLEQISFNTGDVQGPLDLILKLISHHKLNIYDIEINELVDQYISAIETLDIPKMESASEFLEMASRLVYIKTVSLLPKHEDETERLKQELEGELIEYQSCKLAAQLLGDRFEDNLSAVREMSVFPDIESFNTDEHLGEAQMLLKSYIAVIGKKLKITEESVKKFEPLVKRPIISVRTAMLRVIRKFYFKSVMTVEELVEDIDTKDMAVAVFLALLELIKGGRISVFTDEDKNEIKLKLKGRSTTLNLMQEVDSDDE